MLRGCRGIGRRYGYPHRPVARRNRVHGRRHDRRRQGGLCGCRAGDALREGPLHVARRGRRGVGHGRRDRRRRIVRRYVDGRRDDDADAGRGDHGDAQHGVPPFGRADRDGRGRHRRDLSHYAGGVEGRRRDRLRTGRDGHRVCLCRRRDDDRLHDQHGRRLRLLGDLRRAGCRRVAHVERRRGRPRGAAGCGVDLEERQPHGGLHHPCRHGRHERGVGRDRRRAVACGRLLLSLRRVGAPLRGDRCGVADDQAGGGCLYGRDLFRGRRDESRAHQQGQPHGLLSLLRAGGGRNGRRDRIGRGAAARRARNRRRRPAHAHGRLQPHDVAVGAHYDAQLPARRSGGRLSDQSLRHTARNLQDVDDAQPRLGWRRRHRCLQIGLPAGFQRDEQGYGRLQLEDRPHVQLPQHGGAQSGVGRHRERRRAWSPTLRSRPSAVATILSTNT